MTNVTLILHDTDRARILFGEHDKHIEIIEKHFHVEIQIRGTILTFKGSPKNSRFAQSLTKQLYDLVEKNHPLKTQDIDLACRMFSENPGQPIATYFQQPNHSAPSSSGHPHSIVPKTPNQKMYME